MLLGGYRSVQRHGVMFADVLPALQLILVPIHLSGNHWALGVRFLLRPVAFPSFELFQVIFPSKQEVRYYDSLGGHIRFNREVLVNLFTWYQREMLEIRQVVVERSHWELVDESKVFSSSWIYCPFFWWVAFQCAA